MIVVGVALKKKMMLLRPCCYFEGRNMASFFPELWPLERVSELGVVNPTVIFH